MSHQATKQHNTQCTSPKHTVVRSDHRWCRYRCHRATRFLSLALLALPRVPKACPRSAGIRSCTWSGQWGQRGGGWLGTICRRYVGGAYSLTSMCCGDVCCYRPVCLKTTGVIELCCILIWDRRCIFFHINNNICVCKQTKIRHSAPNYCFENVNHSTTYPTTKPNHTLCNHHPNHHPVIYFNPANGNIIPAATTPRPP